VIFKTNSKNLKTTLEMVYFEKGKNNNYHLHTSLKITGDFLSPILKYIKANSGVAIRESLITVHQEENQS